MPFILLFRAFMDGTCDDKEILDLSTDDNFLEEITFGVEFHDVQLYEY